MGGFSQGASIASNAFNESQQIAEQERVQNQNTVGARLLDSINSAAAIKPPTDPQTIQDETGKTVPNPVYQSKKAAYDEAQAQKADLFQKYVSLNSPEQHASFGDRLHGLIFGNPTEHAQQPALSPNSAPVKPVADPNAPAPVAPPPDPNAPGGGVPHPLAAAPADHPLNAITNGIKTLGSHLAAFAHPTLPDKTSATAASLAASYQDPAELAHERALELAAQAQAANERIWGSRIAGNIDVAKIRAQYTTLNTPEKMRIDAGAKALGYDNFYSAPPEVMDSLLKQYKTATRAPAKSIVMDPSSPTGYSAAEWDTGTGQPISYFQGVLPPPGFVPKHRATTVVDQYGNQTTTISDLTPGISAAGAPPLPAANPVVSGGHPPVSSAAPPFPSASPANPVLQSPPSLTPSAAAPTQSANPGARLPGTRPAGGAVKTARPVSSFAPPPPGGSLPPLDANGNIPDGVGNPQVREFANDLLNDRDTDKIPPKARAAAEAMARPYGWEQGKFTPMQLSQIQQSSSLLQRMTSDPAKDPQSLAPVVDKVFSSGAAKRGLISARIHGAGPSTPMQGVEQAFQNKLALDDNDVAFIQLYRNMLGRIQGLSQLTRGGVRSSEQAVKRMISELPDPVLVSSPTQARNAFALVQNELDIALAKKEWGDGTVKGPVSSKAPPAPGGINWNALPKAQ